MMRWGEGGEERDKYLYFVDQFCIYLLDLSNYINWVYLWKRGVAGG